MNGPYPSSNRRSRDRLERLWRQVPSHVQDACAAAWEDVRATWEPSFGTAAQTRHVQSQPWASVPPAGRFQIAQFVWMQTATVALRGWPGVRIECGEPGQVPIGAHLPEGGLHWLLLLTDPAAIEPCLVPDVEARQAIGLPDGWRPDYAQTWGGLIGQRLRRSVEDAWEAKYSFEFWARANDPRWPDVPWMRDVKAASDAAVAAHHGRAARR